MKPRLALHLLAFGFLSVFSVVAQDRPQLHIADLSIPDGITQLQTVSTVVTETIALSLRLMGDYHVSTDQDGAEPGAVSPGDRIIGGECLRDDDGAIRFQLAVMSTEGGEALFKTEHVAESLFDVFDVADQAVLSLLEGLNQRAIQFGALQIRADADGRGYAVTLNGEPVASDLSGTYRNDRIVEGTYQLTVVQTRLPGPLPVLEQAVEIRADQTAEVELYPPAVLPEEALWLQERGVGRRVADGTGGSAAAAVLQELADSGTLPPPGPLRSFIENAAALERAGSAGIIPDGPFGAAVPPERNGRLGKVFPGTVQQFLHEHVTHVRDHWNPQVSVHVSPEGQFLGMSLKGLTGADRVTVTGPAGSGIHDHELRDGGSISTYGNGIYDSFLTRPENIAAGDIYRFDVERRGTTIVLEAEVLPFPTELTAGLRIGSIPEGYQVEWQNIAPVHSHTLIISATEHTMPAPGAWQWSVTVPGDSTSFIVPRGALETPGDWRLHLFSGDTTGNRVWTSQRFYHSRYYSSFIHELPRRTIEIDGNAADWTGVIPISANGSLVNQFYLAADDVNLYWAIATGERKPGTFYPQVQIYNSFDEWGEHNAALLARVQQGRTATLSFDHWKNPSLRREYTQGAMARSSNSFLEMSIPLEYIDLGEFELDLVAQERDNGPFTHLVDRMWVRLP